MTWMELLARLRELANAHVDAGGRGAQARLATALGTYPANISNFLRGEAGLSVETAEKLADLLGYTVDLVPKRSPAPPAGKRKPR